MSGSLFKLGVKHAPSERQKTGRFITLDGRGLSGKEEER
jgi:hypothetical protein